jgi:hypothetical protein
MKYSIGNNNQYEKFYSSTIASVRYLMNKLTYVETRRNMVTSYLGNGSIDEND